MARTTEGHLAFRCDTGWSPDEIAIESIYQTSSREACASASSDEGTPRKGAFRAVNSGDGRELPARRVAHVLREGSAGWRVRLPSTPPFTRCDRRSRSHTHEPRHVVLVRRVRPRCRPGDDRAAERRRPIHVAAHDRRRSLHATRRLCPGGLHVHARAGRHALCVRGDTHAGRPRQQIRRERGECGAGSNSCAAGREGHFRDPELGPCGAQRDSQPAAQAVRQSGHDHRRAVRRAETRSIRFNTC